MADIDLERRIATLELRILSLPGLGQSLRADEGNTNGCTNCDTNGCTNCRATEMMNVLLPGEDRPLTSREIVKLLAQARGQ